MRGIRPQALDEVTAKAMAPAEKLRSLLQAPDKRKALLDMACASHSPLSLDSVSGDTGHYLYFLHIDLLCSPLYSRQVMRYL